MNNITSGQSNINKQKILLWFGIIFLVSFCLAPLLWQILTSLKTNEAIIQLPTVYLPALSQLTLKQYTILGREFLRYMLNSGFVSLTSTIIALTVGAPAAYSLARLKIPGEKIILGLILIVSLFPYVLLFLGLLELVKFLGTLPLIVLVFTFQKRIVQGITAGAVKG